MMHLVVKVKDVYSQKEYFYALDLNDAGFYEEFDSLHVSDSPLLAYATGDKLASSEEVRKFVKLRKDTAKNLGKEIARQIVRLMEREDTINGYPVEP